MTYVQTDILLRDIPGFENYQLGENGEVYSKLTGIELKKQKSPNGYL